MFVLHDGISSDIPQPEDVVVIACVNCSLHIFNTKNRHGVRGRFLSLNAKKRKVVFFNSLINTFTM